MNELTLLRAYLPHRRQIRKYLRRRLHGVHHQSLEDVEQELMIRLLRASSIDTEKLREPLAYFYAAARFVVVDHVLAYQKALVHGIVFETEAIEEALDEDSVVQDVSDDLVVLDELNWVLRQLPEIQRLILVLHHMDGYKISEIAETLSIPYGTVDKYVARAKKRSRELLAARHMAQGKEWA